MLQQLQLLFLPLARISEQLLCLPQLKEEVMCLNIILCKILEGEFFLTTQESVDFNMGQCIFIESCG